MPEDTVESPAPVEAVRRAVELALGDGGLRPPGGRVLVALSGGPDSRVLLDALCALRGRLDLTLTACVVDHGLRAGSGREAEGALEIAHRLGVPGTIERAEIVERSARGARDARYLCLGRAAARCGAEAIALGHTASDQAETLLDHLLRGAGSRGLGAMAPRRPLGVLQGTDADTRGTWLIRPLLAVSRHEIEAYVAAEGLAVVRDPTNEDLRFRRSRIRARVLPLLREERADLDHALARLCERLRLDAEYLDAEAARATGELTGSEGWLDLDALERLHPAIAARVLRGQCEQAGVPGDRVPLEALLRLARGRHGSSQIDLPLARVAERRYRRLRIGAPGAAPQPIGEPVPVGRSGVVELGGLRLRVPARWLDRGPLVLRRPRRGDRVRGRRLSDLLVDQKVPRPERAHLVGLAGPDGGLVWVGLLRQSAAIHGPAAAQSPGEIAWEWPSSGERPRITCKEHPVFAPNEDAPPPGPPGPKESKREIRRKARPSR